MKVFRMNEFDTVLHNSFEEAVKHYDGFTGVFEECKDEDTGKEYEIDSYIVCVNEPGEETEKMSVKQALEEKRIECPIIFSTEGW